MCSPRMRVPTFTRAHVCMCVCSWITTEVPVTLNESYSTQGLYPYQFTVKTGTAKVSAVCQAQDTSFALGFLNGEPVEDMCAEAHSLQHASRAKASKGRAKGDCVCLCVTHRVLSSQARCGYASTGGGALQRTSCWLLQTRRHTRSGTQGLHVHQCCVP